MARHSTRTCCTKILLRTAIAGLGWMFATAPLPAAVPGWIETAAAQEVPSELQEADAVILHREIVFDYRRRGRVSHTVREAVRVLKPDGRSAATLALPYNEKSDRIRDLEIWILPTEGRPVRLRHRDCIDLELGAGELYTEYRSLHHSAADEARPGTVYAYSYSIEQRSLFAENAFVLNAPIPILHSRLEIAVPNKWAVRSHVSNDRVALEESSQDQWWRWTAREISAVKEEQWRSQVANLRTVLYFTVEPATEDARAYPLLSWSDWAGVASYVKELSDETVEPDEEVRAKALQLTAGTETEWEKIRAIGNFVQDINYVSLALDLGQGGGYQPHPAGETLRTHYGDCKDKANLMRSLLGVIGIEAFPVVAQLSGEEDVDPAWPSPAQFNHCIVGISVAVPPESGPVVNHAALGPVLLFDPTDEDTRFGHINHALQGTHALIGTVVDDPLITIPFAAPDENRTERRIDASLSSQGDVTGRVETRYAGLAATPLQGLHQRRGRAELERQVFSQLRLNLRDVTITDLVVLDSADAEALELSLAFGSRGYARSMRGRLLIFQPAMITRNTWMPPADANRETRVRFPPQQLIETTVVELPEGFVVEEIPGELVLNQPYAAYNCTTTIDGRKLTFHREITWRPVTIPAEDYDEMRGFFRAMLDADSASVVLVRE